MEYLPTIGAFLSGGLIVTIVGYFLDKKKDAAAKLNGIMEDKYKSLLVFMACVIDIDKRRYFTLNEQVPNKTAEDYLKQIEEYYYHSILYAPDDVIKKLKKFIIEPNRKKYIEVAIAMRNDLWKRKIKLTDKDIIINN